VSDRSFTRVLDAVRMSTGTNFEEELVGTNGIGTAMESRDLASVIGPDHYCQAFHVWACVAAPIRDPIANNICGAVNVTCWASDANEFLRGMTRALADGVNRRLVELAHPRERALLDAFLHGRARTTAPVLAVDAQTMIADEVAGSWGLEHSAIWAAVSSMRPGSHHVTVREGLRAQVWPIDPDSIAAGAAVALYPDSPRAVAPAVPEVPTGHGLGPLEAAEADVIARVLAECEGNKSATAARLQISRATLYQKLRRYRLAWAPESNQEGR
jgi:sigma-54 dependent transcriptional regulator, acetoin dehydrogenase operon transcriptional activator AcoR